MTSHSCGTTSKSSKSGRPGHDGPLWDADVRQARARSIAAAMEEEIDSLLREAPRESHQNWWEKVNRRPLASMQMGYLMLFVSLTSC